VRAANDVPTGKVLLARHASACPLSDVGLIANLTEADARRVSPKFASKIRAERRRRVQLRPELGSFCMVSRGGSDVKPTASTGFMERAMGIELTSEAWKTNEEARPDTANSREEIEPATTRACTWRPPSSCRISFASMLLEGLSKSNGSPAGNKMWKCYRAFSGSTDSLAKLRKRSAIPICSLFLLVAAVEHFPA
jgi:hypothetical protein